MAFQQLLVFSYIYAILGRAVISNLQPRGVSKTNSGLYKPGSSFRCLDGSDTIPFEHVNDDYCDCKDGSDEPGTAACPNGKFYCVNVGYRPEVIPSSKVSDGFCDCCDGTDEYEKKVGCLNTCPELGKALQEVQDTKREQIEGGLKLRAELINKARTVKEEAWAKLEELRPRKEQLEKLQADLLEVKSAAEDSEREAKSRFEELSENTKDERSKAAVRQRCEKAFMMFDTNNDNFLTREEAYDMHVLDRDGDGIVTDDEVTAIIGETVRVNRDTFCAEAYPILAPVIHTMSLPPTSPPRTERENQGGTEQEDSDEDFEDDDTDPARERLEVMEADDTPYPPETLLLIEVANKAREEVRAAENERADVVEQIRKLENILETDNGPDDVFLYIRNECYDFTDREYTYTFCPFKHVVQKSKHGGSETSLGSYNGWFEKDSYKYSGMRFTQGDNCWKGPDRSATVVFSCGSQTRLLSATEPNRCEYMFEFETPTACVETLDTAATGSTTSSLHYHHYEL